MSALGAQLRLAPPAAAVGQRCGVRCRAAPAAPRVPRAARPAPRLRASPAAMRAVAGASSAPLAAGAPEAAASAVGAAPKRRVAVFVEPSPFSHTSGMKNRFLNLIANLTEQGDEVIVFAPDANPPAEYRGAKVYGLAGVPLPFYNSTTLRLSPGLSPRVWSTLREWKPDIVHVACPGVLVFAAQLYAYALSVPLVVSYHTHIPEYIKSYTWQGLAAPMWALIRFWSRAADVMLVTSSVMATELTRHACRSSAIALWRRGVDVDIFNPSFRSAEARAAMSNGDVDAPLLVYVGRLGAEKNLAILKDVLEANPGARLALVGDGPARAQLEAHFAGTKTVFTGMLSGTALSAAFASADVFVMPSETETLGFVVLEAMASGLPVVAVAAGGIPDIITQPGTTGLLYPAGDVAAASAAVASLLASAKSRAAIGAAGRADVERWGWPAASRHLREDLYSRAVARFARRGAARRELRARRAAAALHHLLPHTPAASASLAMGALVLVAAVAAGAPAAMRAHALAVAGSASSHVALAAFIAAMGALPLVPMQPLAALAGYKFGGMAGFAVAWAGVTGAAVAAYWTVRLNGRGPLLRDVLLPLGTARPFLAYQLDYVAAAARAGGLLRGTRAVAALRLRPLAPFSLSNYLAVDTGIRAASFFTGTAIGMLPWCALYAAAGAAWRAHASSGAALATLGARALDAAAALPEGAIAVAVAAAVLAYCIWPGAEAARGAAAARAARRTRRCLTA